MRRLANIDWSNLDPSADSLAGALKEITGLLDKHLTYDPPRYTRYIDNSERSDTMQIVPVSHLPLVVTDTYGGRSRGTERPFLSPLDDSKAKTLLEIMEGLEKILKRYPQIEYDSESLDYFRDKAKDHLSKLKSPPTNWEGTYFSKYRFWLEFPYTYDVIKLDEEFKNLVREKWCLIFESIVIDAEKNVFDQSKYDLLNKAKEAYNQSAGALTSFEYKELALSLLNLKDVESNLGWSFIDSTMSALSSSLKYTHKGGMLRISGVGLMTHRWAARHKFKVFTPYKDGTITFDFKSYSSLSKREEEQYLMIKSVLYNDKYKKQLRSMQSKRFDEILEKFHDSIREGKKLTKEDRKKIHYIFRHTPGLVRYESKLFLDEKPKREKKPSSSGNFDKVVLNSDDSKKLELLDEAISKAKGSFQDTLTQYRALVMSGKKLNEDQLKDIRSMFYRMGMRPQTNFFRQASAVRVAKRYLDSL